MEYNFREIEKKWQQYWAENKTYKALDNSNKNKYYVLDMFPYPSGAGLHVGHPLGYIASDIIARYKRHKGFNVLHPMGYDSFGLPAEQYAIQTGQHPAITTEQNIKRYREQLDKIGFSFDWDREVRTSDPNYYKWTQWIFIQLFNSWYNPETDKAEAIETLIEKIIKNPAHYNLQKNWNELSEKEQSDFLMNYRLAYLSEAYVNWCPALGTVLANDEVKDGVSERGGHPVERKLMKQWSLRITAYAERLLKGLDTIDWSESIKEAQRNWIGKSEGTTINFHLSPSLSKGEGKPGYYTTDSQMWNILIEKAKEMRSKPTPAEDALWQQLRAKKIDAKFRRQHIIDRFIVDFVCLDKLLVVEVDGDIHDYQKEEDANRTAVLEEKGFKVIRFRNEEVLADTENVLIKLKHELEARPSIKESLPLGEVGGVITVFTTRPDTIFGVSYLTLAPEHELVEKITTSEQKAKVEAYITYAKNRSERERQADVKKVTGEFTGAYAIHPFTGKQIPIWVGDYVLAGYGTGAVMAVPMHDERDFAFAKHFEKELTQQLGHSPFQKVVLSTEVIKHTPNPSQEGNDIPKFEFIKKENKNTSNPSQEENETQKENKHTPNPSQEGNECYTLKEGRIINSDFLNGLEVKEAIKTAIAEIEKRGIGKGQINYRLRDAVFGRQRYWGEPIPIYYKDLSPNPSTKEEKNTNNLIPCVVDEKHLPIILPEIDKYLPTEDGEPPLARAEKWYYDLEKGVCTPPSGGRAGGGVLEFTTMPGWAGSSWYFLRYMDPKNEKEFVSKQAAEYWKEIDLYIGGAEHATGHLLYFRFWTKFLKDLGYISIEEPAKKLINQGMIQGTSAIIFRINGTNKIVSAGLKNKYETTPIHIDVNIVENSIVNIEELKKWRDDFANAEFELEDGKLICHHEVEKMSKRWFNVVTPDVICEKFGADTLRLYEMFLGPLEQHKPWNTNGITGVHNFLKKLWRLVINAIETEKASPQGGGLEGGATKAELKALHKCIKKVNEDIERFSFNTSVSNFMICVNELSDLRCNKREILEPLIVLISPYAPHIAEELWSKLGHTESIEYAPYPTHNEAYLTEDNFKYPVSFNGKMRFNIELPITLTPKEVEEAALAAPEAQKWLEGKTPKKVIVVPKKIVNIVV